MASAHSGASLNTGSGGVQKLDWLICTGAVLIFLLLSGWDISLPGLQYDECLGAAPAVNFVTGRTETEPMQIDPSVIHIFGRPLPVMVMTYIGPVKTLLHIPVFFIGGISPPTVRLLPIIVVALSIILTFVITRTLFDTWSARVAVLLIAVDPSFVYYLTRDVGPAALQVFFKLLAFWLFIRWWQTNRSYYFALAMLSLGLGISHKVDFIWVIGGLIVAVLPLLGKRMWQRINWKLALAGCAAFSVGSAPIIAFNIATGGYTFLPFLAKLSAETSAGQITIGTSIAERFDQLIGLLNGELLTSLFSGLPLFVKPITQIVPATLGLSALGILFFSFQKERARSVRPLLGLWVYSIVVFSETLFSPTTLSAHHLLALYPGLHMIIAASIGMIRESSPLLRRFWIGRIFVASLFFASLAATLEIGTSLRSAGGTGYWSDAINDLNRYLKERNAPVVAMEWGFTNNLIVLSKGELKIHRAYKDAWKEPLTAKAITPYLDPASLFLFYAPTSQNGPSHFSALEQASAEHGFELVQERSFVERTGREVYTLYRLRPRTNI